MNLECPHCKATFTSSDATPGTFARCTSCERRFLVAGLNPTTPPDDDAFPPELMIFCVIIVLVVLALVLAAITTPGISIGIVLSIGFILLTVWKRKAIDQYLTQCRKQAAARRLAKKQAAAQAAVAQDAPESAGPVEPVAVASPMDPAAVASNGQQPDSAPVSESPTGGLAGNSLREGEPGSTSPPVTSAPVSPTPAITAPAASVVPPSPPPEPEPELLTAGLPEKYRVFLDAAMTQSQWPLRDLEAMARLHHLSWDDVLIAINQWAQDRFGESMLVQDGEEVWVQLPLI
ncbi:MAG: hypothetical protein HQ518_22245 [Rhodopirellula sp.]|nr:hypothetical protein [Rhodopirellula sp.]